nr:N-acetylmuramoyl-L-alanine amidase [Desulforamulus aquiferis]
MNRGEKRANFLVLRDTSMPALLLENLFIDNPRDAALLKDSDFINGLALAIADGIVESQLLSPLTQENPTIPADPIIQNPTVPPVWDPQGEIDKLIASGIIVNNHQADTPVTWGQLATVLNRIIERNKL